MNNNEFVLAGDGWVQVTPCGEFPHVGAGVTQVIDREACDRIASISVVVRFDLIRASALSYYRAVYFPNFITHHLGQHSSVGRALDL